MSRTTPCYRLLWLGMVLTLLGPSCKSGKGTTQPPNPPPITGRTTGILFSSTRDNAQGEIYVMNPDGTNYLRLTNNSQFDVGAVWSPDGKKIVSLSTDVWVMKSDGSNPMRLTDSPTVGEAHPQWSPDGSKIAWIGSGVPGTGDLLIMNADGSSKTHLTDLSVRDFSWSADGAKIAYSIANGDSTDGLYVMDADGSNRTRISLIGTGNIRFSPDRSKIVFTSDSGNSNPDIHVINSDGTGLLRLTTDPACDDYAVWSPDGTKIAFWSIRDGNGQVWVMNADGSNQVRIGSPPGNATPRLEAGTINARRNVLSHQSGSSSVPVGARYPHRASPIEVQRQ